ncbi:MAG: hypothetical protein H6R40_1243, partial [Gemmatimonadetes bacterium]|nr:hypothetical protein [Gemmatimonadota bacterium]
MTRKLVPVLIAIALGDIKVRSALNEPLDAEIELVSVRGDELADLRAGIASTEEFRRAGVERPYLLSRLRFRVEEKAGGKAVLRVSTRQPVKEPFLNFLVEINWPQGRLVREYTALLDPPVYGAAASAGVRGPVVRAEPEAVVPPPVEAPSVQAAPSEPGPVVATEPAPAAPTPAPVAEEVVFAPAPAPVAREAAPAPAVAGRDAYGPTRAGDTLWGIANRVRPDAS